MSKNLYIQLTANQLEVFNELNTAFTNQGWEVTAIRFITTSETEAVLVLIFSIRLDNSQKIKVNLITVQLNGDIDLLEQTIEE